MSRLLCKLHFAKVVQDEEGQAMVEYGLLVSLISIAAIAIIALIGPQLITMFTSVLTALGGKVG